MSAKGKGRKRGFLIRLLLLLNLLAVAALLLAYAALFTDPSKWVLPAFAGLGYPYLVVLNFLFILIWAFVRWKYALISLIAILSGWGVIRSSLGTGGGEGDDGKGIKVMSYNVRNFDLYNYNPDWSHHFEKRNSIYRYLKQEDPDILCFQEFVHDLTGDFKTMDTLPQFLKAGNVHAGFTVNSRNMNQFGIATFTRYPILFKGMIDFPNSLTNVCIYTDILVGEDTVRVYNAHFESLHFSRRDSEFAEKVSKGDADNKEDLRTGFRRIYSKLRQGFIRRAEQVRMVEEHIRNCPYPVILCTDMNDTPVSYAYRRLARLLDDAFVQSGRGFGNTYTGIYPYFRIDYIFVSEDFKTHGFRSVPGKDSDHYPVWCFVEKRERK